jgi:translocation and assembly module TamB
MLAQLLCLIFGVIGAVPFGVGLLVRTPPVRDWAARETAAVLARELGVAARYRVEVQAWPLSIGLSDVSVEGSDGLGVALAAARIAVRPRLFSLMAGRLDAGHIEIDAPQARVVVRDGAIANVSYHLPKAPDSGPIRHAPFTSVAITDAAVDLDVDGMGLKGRDIDVDVTAEDGPVFDVALRAGEQTIVRARSVLATDPKEVGRPAVDEDILCQLDARVRLAKDSVLVRRLELAGFADSDVEPGTAPTCSVPVSDPRRVEVALSHVQASLPHGGSPEFEGSVHARVPVGLVNRFITFPKLKGYVSVDVEGRYGKGTTLPVLRGKVGGSGLELDNYHLIRELAADVAIDDDVIRSNQASVGFADGTIVAKNLIVEPLKKGVTMHIGSSEATNVRFPAIMRDVDVTPHAHVNWVYKSTHVAALDGTLAPLKLDAEFTSNTSDFEVFDKAIDDPARRHMIGVKEAKVAGHVSIRPDAVIFRNARTDFGDSHLEGVNVSLGFHNDITLSVGAASKIDLANISPLASLKLAGKATMGAEMKGKFNDPVLTGDLAVTGFSIDDFPLGDISSSKVRFRPLTVDFSEIHAKKNKSSFDVPTARLDFNGPATLVADANVDASDLYVRDFLHMWHFDTDPRFDEIDGHGRTKAGVHYELGGPNDACGNGILTVRGGLHMVSMDLFEEHYDSLDSDFTYNWFDRDAADLGLDVDVRSMTLKKGRGSLFGSGTIRRGGVVRAQLVADEVPLARIQTMGALGKVLEGSASAVGTVSGTIDQLEADVDVKMTPLRVGGSVLPASKVHVSLVPAKKDIKVLRRTRCGQPVTTPFDRAEYDRDISQGMFHVSGQLFDGQVAFDDYQVTRQRKKVSSGLVKMSKLDLTALGGLAQAKDASEQGGGEPPSGSLSATLDIASLALDAPERMRATLGLTALDMRSKAGKIGLKEAAPPISVGDDKLVLPPLTFDFTAGGGLHGQAVVGGELKKLSSSPEVNLSAKVAPLDLSSLASVVPKVERASGTLEASLNVSGKLAAPVYSGEAHLKKAEFSMRGLALPLSDVNVDLAIGGGEVRVTRGTGTVGGGAFTLAGHAPIHGFKMGDVTGVISAKGVSLPLVDGISMTCDADLRAEWGEHGGEDEEPSLPRVSGDVVLTSFSYTRPIGIAADIGSLAQRGRRKMFESYDPADDAVTFDVKLRSRDPLKLRNNLVEAQLMVDSDALVFSGTNQRFGLRGRMRIMPGGHIRLRANDFEVKQGYVRFDDPTRIAPSVDVTAVTEYRRYSAASGGAAGAAAGASAAGGASRTGGVWRITLHAYGDADNLRLDMTSEPALSQEDIVLLLTIGMTRAEIDQLQASSLGGTAALEALSSLTGADSAVKKAVPVIDDFRFGSAYSSRTGSTEATVTLGKRVTDQVRANVTSGLSENREIRSNLEWKLTPRVSVQGSYDNVNDVSSSSLGNLGADVRWRLEFE